MLVAYKDWVGQIDLTWDKLCLIFDDGSIRIPNDAEQLKLCDPISLYSHFAVGERLNPGDKVTSDDGTWSKGSFNENMGIGTIMNIKTTQVRVKWILYNSLKVCVYLDFFFCY